MKGLEHRGLTRVEGPIVVLERPEDVGLGDLVVVRDRERGERAGRIIDLSDAAVVVQVFGSTTGLSTEGSSVEFAGRPLTLRASRDMLGRVFDGLGRPRDGQPRVPRPQRARVPNASRSRAATSSGQAIEKRSPRSSCR